jgi:hypothetical protein
MKRLANFSECRLLLSLWHRRSLRLRSLGVEHPVDVRALRGFGRLLVSAAGVPVMRIRLLSGRLTHFR